MEHPRLHDTEPAAAALRVQILRRMSGAERLRMALDMTAAVRALSVARLRGQHPDWTEIDLKRELLRYAFLPSEPPRAYP